MTLNIRGLIAYGFKGLSLVALMCILGLHVVFATGKSLDKSAVLASGSILPGVGRYVVIDAQKAGIVHPEKHMMKKILGMPGDVVTQNKNRVCVNGYCLQAKPRAHSGELLSPIGSQIIPDGYLFVAGEHRDSFDSRYARFNLVSMAAVKRYAVALF